MGDGEMSHGIEPKRRVLLGWATALACGSAFAATDKSARCYAVLALVGDTLTVVTYRPSVGSFLDRNQATTVTLGDRTFDRTAVFAVRDALLKQDPHATTALMQAADNAIYGEQSRLIDGQRILPPPWLTQALAEASATHLVLITKQRAPANLTTASGHVGTGHLTGLGFYVDNDLATARSDTGERARGFVAAYAHLRVTLVDVATNRVMGEQSIATGHVRSAARNVTGVDPWNALTTDEKVASLNSLIESEVPKAVAALVH